MPALANVHSAIVPGPTALQPPASHTLVTELEHVPATHAPMFPDHSVPLPLSRNGKVRLADVPGSSRNVPVDGVGIVQKQRPFAVLHALPRVQFALLEHRVTFVLLYPAEPDTR